MPELRKPIPEDFQRAQKLMEHWSSIRDEVPTEIKDKIGKLFIEHILDLGNETAEKFVKGANENSMDVGTYHLVGMKMAGFKSSEEDAKKFWSSVREIEPQALPGDEDLKLAIAQDDGWGAATLIWRLEMSIKEPSFVLLKLGDIAHQYK